ncbi:MAG: cache domain-containing protein [Desulfobacteraceae bacterium]|nr:cache domain-containing protein [Desulfobacteraceae bacterium]
MKKAKLMAAVGALLVAGFLITSLASYFVSRKSLRAEISLNELPLTSDNIYSEIQRDLLSPIFISSLMASDTFLRDWVMAGETDETQITRYLKEIKTRYNTFTSFFISEKTRTYYHFDGILKRVSEKEERDAWYFRVRDMKENYEINFDPDLANKDNMTIFINYRVFDYDHQYIGATGVGLTIHAVNERIENYQEKYKRTIYFVDKKGDIKLTGPGFDKTITNISHFGQDFRDRLNETSESSFSYVKDGPLIHANIRYIKEFGWYLVVEQAEEETLKQIHSTLLMNLAVCLAVTLVILILVNMAVTAYQQRIETLRGIVPICSFCKQIRDDKGYWNRVEAYVAKYTDAKFSHSVCPSCMEKHYPEEFKYAEEKRKKRGNKTV